MNARNGASQGRGRRSDGRVHFVAWVGAAFACTWALVSRDLALLFLGGIAATWYLVPLVGRLAARRGATVLPGGRSIHAEPTPLLGGLAIYLPFVAYLLYAGGPLHLGLAAGATVMVGLGAWDDLRGLGPRVKILGQVAAALVLVASGYGVPELRFPPVFGIATTGFEIVVVVFWIVLVTNAFNLIDGLDGLGASAALVGALACAGLDLSVGPALVLAGTTLGFLRHNLPRARIFLGDTGSLLIGFALAAFLLNGAGPVNVPIALGVLALPLGDVAITTLRRWLRGKPVFSGDRRHVHHRLLDLWHRPQLVVAALACLATFQAAAVVALPDAFGLAAVCALWAAAVAYLLTKAGPHWTRIFLNRKNFRRLHLVRSYATGALRLAEGQGEVAGILRRVAEDLRLASLRVRSVRFEQTVSGEGIRVEEHVDCGATTASWSASFLPTDPVLAEEKRNVLCDLLRLADTRLGALAGEPATPPAPASPEPVPAANGRPRVHFIADSRERLRRLTPFVQETGLRGTLQPVLVYTGRRDDLGLTDAQLRELGIGKPDVELDVVAEPGIVQTARIMERYHALAATQMPSVVVVGESSASLSCALVARERGIPVAQIADSRAAPAPVARPLGNGATESIADLVLAPEHRISPGAAPTQLAFVEDAPVHEARELVPVLEALLAGD